MNTLVVICSKSPNIFLYECIESLYKIQIVNESNYKICIIDSDSDDLSYYEKVKIDFPNVEIFFIKNKNHEYGAWKYALSIYPNYDIYFCIQDSIIVKKKIDLNIVDDINTYTCSNNSGYNSHISIKHLGIENLKNSDLNYETLIDTYFNLAQHNIFIVNNDVMKNIFDTLQIPPTNKNGSCFYERNFGLYFIIKRINTIDLNNYIIKCNGKRL